MQVTIARQLNLDPSTVSNFFMNARRRSVDKWKDENESFTANTDIFDDDEESDCDEDDQQPQQHHQQQQLIAVQHQPTTMTLAQVKQAVLVHAAPVAVQQLQPPQGDLTSAGLDL